MIRIESLTPSFTTPDLSACLHFYCDVLGFQRTSEHEQDGRLAWVELTSGSAVLMLLAAEDEPRSERAAEARYDAAGTIFYLRVGDLAAVRDALARTGADVSPLEVTFYGMREVYVCDPDGRQLTLAEPSDPADAVTVREL